MWMVSFGNFPLRGGLENIWSTGQGTGLLGGLKNLGGSKNFNEFCKNVIETFSKIE